MEPNENNPKPAHPLFGMITTTTYEGPITRDRRPFISEASNGMTRETYDKLHQRLELVNGATPIVTFVIDRNTGRTYKKEE